MTNTMFNDHGLNSPYSYPKVFIDHYFSMPQTRNHVVMYSEDHPKYDEIGQLDTTVDAWKAEMEDFLSGGDPGVTVAELAEEFNCGKSTMRERLNKLVKAGRCIKGRGTRVDSVGRYQIMPVYQLLGEEK